MLWSYFPSKMSIFLDIVIIGHLDNSFNNSLPLFTINKTLLVVWTGKVNVFSISCNLIIF